MEPWGLGQNQSPSVQAAGENHSPWRHLWRFAEIPAAGKWQSGDWDPGRLQRPLCLHLGLTWWPAGVRGQPRGRCVVQASPVASLYLTSGGASPISFPLRLVETALDNSNMRITPFWEARPPPSLRCRDPAAAGSDGRGGARSRCSGVDLCSLCPPPAVRGEYQVLGPGCLPGDLQ